MGKQCYKSVKKWMSILTTHKPSQIYHISKGDLRACLKYGVAGQRLRIEACSICQLRCPGCAQSVGDSGVFGRGYLKFNDFKLLLDKYTNFNNIELSNNGEIFLNPDLPKIIQYAHERNVTLEALNGVNLNTVHDSTLETLVKHRFRIMSISIDGASNETYKIYRVGGNLDRVIENINKVNFYKKKYNSDFPVLIWQFIPFGHNEHEIETAKKMAAELSMKFEIRLNSTPSLFPLSKTEAVRSESHMKAASIDEYERQDKVYNISACLQMWVIPQINWDGKLLGCCFQNSGHFGNVFEQGLEACLRSEKYRYAKDMLLGNVEHPREDIPCSTCVIYKSIRSSPAKTAYARERLGAFDFNTPFDQLLYILSMKFGICPPIQSTD